MASTDTPGRGSFRGVPFLVYQEQRERGGRNIVRREYPLRESGGADDLGPKLPEFTFTVLVTGDDLQTQRSRLRDALRAPGAGELMHPDYGTLNVLINSFESRYNASEQGTVEFTINVIPASDDTAPSVAEDTAAALEQKSGSAMNQLFNTLSDGWTVISDGLHDVQAMTDTISDKIDALENAVSGMGIVQDISAFTASFTALKGNAAALINAPRRMAESLAGMFAVLAGLPGDPSLSLTGKAGTPSGSLTTNRDSTTEQAMPQLYRTLSSLRYTLSEQDDPQRLIGLTPAAQNNIRLLRSVERFPDTSRLLLEDWERYLGLPECDMAGATLTERQRYAGNKYRMKPSLNREFYIRFAAEFGYQIDIQPSPDSQWVSIVTINSETGYRNMNVLDDILTPLRIYEGGALECILNRYKPAWQTFIYVYANSHEEETI